MADPVKAATQQLINSPIESWYNQDDYRDFQARLARETTLPSEHTSHSPFSLHMCLPNRSQHTSVRVQPQSEDDFGSMDSGSVPALTRGNSVASRRSSSSSSSDSRSVIDGGFVMEEVDNILEVPARLRRDADLLCPFEVLNCDQVFSDIVEFKLHVFSHFRGHPLPRFAPCFVCGHAYFKDPEYDTSLAWNNLLDHMAYQHFRSGEVAVVIKPDIALMRYMWNRKIITDAEFKRAQLVASQTILPGQNQETTYFGRVPEVPMAPSAPMPSDIRQHLNRSVGLSTEPYTMTASRRRDRQESDTQRLRARVLNMS